MAFKSIDPGRRGDSIPEIAFAIQKIIGLECFAPETLHRWRPDAPHPLVWGIVGERPEKPQGFPDSNRENSRNFPHTRHPTPHTRLCRLWAMGISIDYSIISGD
ncbi:MAG: hypothetical protein F6J93_37900 [Oscillatoria sp. SIO1A7]|nr:hypothetical protein [Oscillatoria sp. SIO1A7]